MPTTQQLQHATVIAKGVMRDNSGDQYGTYYTAGLNFLFQDFFSRTRYDRGAGDATLNINESTIDLNARLTSVTDFSTKRIDEISIDEKPVEQVGGKTIRRERTGTVVSGRPTKIYFESKTSGVLDRSADQGYTLHVVYWKPHPILSAPTDAILVPDEYLYQLITHGLPEWLRSGEEKRLYQPTALYLELMQMASGDEEAGYHDMDPDAYK